MIKEFQEHSRNAFPRLWDRTFLLACSGGVDSVVLAHLCAACGMDFALAHCNFRLRGDQSDADEEFVRKLAKNINKKIYVTYFDTIGYINQNKVSVEMAARELRYQWFMEIMKENGLDLVVTAHHADDNLETFLINLSRGTGIDGLTGIPEKTETLARPLLRFSRERIRDYAKREKLDWREDSSNRETKFLRNKVRHEIVPKLKELHPTFLSNFEKTEAYLNQTAILVTNHIQEIKRTLFINENGLVKIHIHELQGLHPLKAYVYALFREYGFTEWEDVLGLVSGMSGKQVFSKTHRLVKDRSFLLLQRNDSKIDHTSYYIEDQQRTVANPVSLFIQPVKSVGTISKKILYVDKETLKYPLVLRKWKKGDYFYPFGMEGTKKLGKFFRDEKMDLPSKERQWLLCSGNDIVWVLGIRADDRFKVTKKSKHILKFTIEE